MHLYKQEGDFGIAQISAPALAVTFGKHSLLPSYGDCWVFFERGHGTILIQEDRMSRIAEKFLSLCHGGFP